MIIKGIIHEVDLIEEKLESLVCDWFKKLDELYFSNSPIVLYLSNLDKDLILKCPECYDKLKVLSFKPNVKIVGENFCEELIE